MTTEQILALKYTDRVHLHCGKMGMGIDEWRVNGKMYTWKKPSKKRSYVFTIPLRQGARMFYHITNENAFEFHLPEECPLREKGEQP